MLFDRIADFIGAAVYCLRFVNSQNGVCLGWGSALGKVNTGIARLTEQQLKALNYFLCGKDSFVCLPTGHGKSLIYLLCPVVAKDLSSSGLEQFPTDPIVVVLGRSKKPLFAGYYDNYSMEKMDPEPSLLLQTQ